MAEQLLHGADVVAIFEQMGGEGVPKCVAGGPPGDADLVYGSMNRSLQSLFVALKNMATQTCRQSTRALVLNLAKQAQV